MKRVGAISFIILVIFLLSFAIAQTDSDEDVVSDDIPIEEENTDGTQDEVLTEERDILDEASNEYSEESLEIDAGTTPGQFGYFIDDFFDNFANEADVMAEKFAEMKKLLDEGKKEEARVALENFREYAKNLQEEASPEDRDKIRKYMAAINHELASLRGEGNDDLISEVEDSARETLSALELSKVIKEACDQLIGLSTSGDVEAEIQFNNLCKPSGDSSKWHKRYYEDLTKEQQEEVKKFVKEIKKCFKDPANCDCSAATSNEAFVNNCELITKAEVDCRAGDDSACQLSEDLGEDIFESLESTPYLVEALEEIEREFSDIEDDRFDNHVPRECREAGITGREKDARRQCMLITLRSDSEEGPPEECREALIEAVENGETSEREFRKICEKAMFEANAPLECLETGINDFKECGKLMFERDAPQECIDAGLTGESPRDHKKCEQIMKSLGRERGPRGEGRGPGINFDCRKIQDSQERLACFDKATSEFREDFRGDNRGRWPPECEEARATDRDSCEKIMRQKFGERREFREGFDNRGTGSFNSGPGSYEYRPPCNTPEECERFRQENPDFRPPSPEGFQQGDSTNEFSQSPSQDFESPSTGESFSDSTGAESTSSSTQDSGSSESTSSSTSSSDGSSAVITGGVISEGNRFLDYYFRFF